MELKQSDSMLTKLSRNLLIVPYGIETKEIYGDADVMRAFNRTLWN